jgi:hypothetical protein
MLDQSFSSLNFNTIFLKENRKGNFKKEHFSQEYIDKHEEFKNVLGEKNDLKALLGYLDAEQLDSFASRLEKINEEKEIIRLNIFQLLCDKICNSKFQFNIIYNPNNKVFSVEKDASSYYAIKQLQHNINRTFKVVQANRNQIIKQLYNVVSDGYPKVIIKTDIRSFYETIPQEKLFHKINDNNLLSPFSKKLIKKLFFEYESKKDTVLIESKKGVPRGIGLSAYLSELYMRDIDSSIKAMDDLVYYARYVDDIIAIFTPKTESSKGDYLGEINRIICAENNLSLKDGSDGEENKTFEINLMDKNTFNETFNFLGYSFSLVRTSKKKFSSLIEMSENKIERYKTRLRQSVEAYNTDSIYNEREARKLLFWRLKFLTGNFHLNNNKRNVKAGIYYSNEMLILNDSNFKSLKRVDDELFSAIQLITPPSKIGINKGKLIEHIKQNFSFENGFLLKEKHFYSFTFSKKETAFYFKKFKRATSKFEVIKTIWI